jgi:predicted NBD/HSP70 family sugar kinase
VRKINTRDFTRATRDTSRTINRQIVLNLVREHQPISRADLARRLRLNRGTVTMLVKTLLDEQAIIEGDTADAPRGRRPKMLHVRTRDRLAIGVDVRFSRTFLMLSDFAARQIAFESFATRSSSPSELVDALAQRIRPLVARHASLGSIEGIGLAVPGMVDQRTGRVRFAPQLGWRDVEIRDALAAATGLPVSIEHASVACAYAQLWLGRKDAAGPDHFVYVTVSDGVGAAVVANGEVMRGATFSAGEFGHVPLHPEGPRCLCGARGCWEAYTSNLATIARYLGHDHSVEDVQAFARLGGPEISIEEVVGLARAGDARARAAIEETGRYLGQGFAIIVNAINPARIVVGGEITEAWSLLEEPVRRAVQERALNPDAAATPIVPELTITYPRLRGAIALVAAPMYAAPRFA